MRRLVWLFLAALCFAQQSNTDFIPASGGLNLGRSNQRWNAYFQNIDILGNCTFQGGTCFGGSSITGTPSAAQIAVFVSSKSIQGLAGFTYDGTNLSTPGLKITTSGAGIWSFAAGADNSSLACAGCWNVMAPVGVTGTPVEIWPTALSAGFRYGTVSGSKLFDVNSELSGDATTSGSTVVTVGKINGTSLSPSTAAGQMPNTSVSGVSAWTAQPNLGNTSVGGQITFNGTDGVHSVTVGCNTLVNCNNFTVAGLLQANTFKTTANCAVNTTSPAQCGAAASGAVVIPTTTTTYTINTSVVTTHSRIQLTWLTFASDLPSAPTCVAPSIASMPTISAVSGGVSFTIAMSSTAGQTCPQYEIFD